MPKNPAERSAPNSYRSKSSTTSQRRERELALQHQRQQRWRIVWVAGTVIVVVIVALAMLSSRPRATSITQGEAPNFILPSTTGNAVSLSSLRDRPVLLYFSEGVGCDACFYQMVDIEAHQAEFTRLGIAVLPIVMNPIDQVRQQMARFGLHDPYLIDSTGQVSSEYHVLGTGMHAGLPGHSFVLIDAQGRLRWEASYPSMFISPANLLSKIESHLGK